jgi:hypothetical protein
LTRNDFQGDGNRGSEEIGAVGAVEMGIDCERKRKGRGKRREKKRDMRIVDGSQLRPKINES